MAAGAPVFSATLGDALSDWAAYSPLLYSQTSGTRGSITRTVTRAVWIRRGGLVHAQGDITAGATSTGGASVQLPVPAIARQMVCGSAAIMGGTPPAQSGIAVMSAALDSIMVTTLANALCDITSGQTFRWSVTYQPA